MKEELNARELKQVEFLLNQGFRNSFPRVLCLVINLLYCSECVCDMNWFHIVGPCMHILQGQGGVVGIPAFFVFCDASGILHIR